MFLLDLTNYLECIVRTYFLLVPIVKMKHRVKSIETMRCSKRKQNVKTIIERKEIPTSTEVTSRQIGSETNGVANQPTETEIAEIESENLIQITQGSHKSTENEENDLDDHKTIEVSQDIKQFSNENNFESNDNNSNCESPETNITHTQQCSKESDIEQNNRMPPSPNGGKGTRAGHSMGLSTIVENIKGEEKEIKKSTNNQTIVQSDQNIDSHEVSGDKNNIHKRAFNGETVEAMSTRILSSSLSDSDAEVIKTLRKSNRPTKGERVLCRKASSNSLRNDKHDTRISVSLSRPSSSQSEPSVISARSNKSQKTKKSSYGISFTKKELEYYLPRKSTFSCHEKALKDAGYDLEAIETKRKRRLRRRKQQINDVDIEENLKIVEDSNTAPESKLSPVEDEEQKCEQTTILEDEQTEMERLKSRRKGKKKDEYEVKVDHTVLLQYLRYVLENRDEYLNHKRQNIQQNSAWLNVDPQCSIARFGRAFQRGQHGQMEETFLLEVAHSIKANYGDGPFVVVQNKDKQSPALPPLKSDQQETTIDEKDKTEYEKVRQKLDRWLKTITSAQLIKAKELSLKELGEEDRLQSQWWSTLQPCRYLRQRTSLF